MKSFVKLYTSGTDFILASVYKQFVEADNANRHELFTSELRKRNIPFKELDVGYLYNKKNKRYIQSEKIVFILSKNKELIKDLVAPYGVRSLLVRENGEISLYALQQNEVKGVHVIKESQYMKPSFNFGTLMETYIEANQKYPVTLNYAVEKSSHKWIFLSEGHSTRFKTILYGKDWLIKSFGIITPENPAGKEAPPDYNASVREEFEEYLKKMKYKFFRVKGKYGSEEKSYMVLNVNVEDLKFLANKYRQKAFIYAERYVASDGVPSMTYYYYEIVKKNRKFKKDYQYDYQVLSSVSKVRDAIGLKDFYTRLKSFQFNIPFPIFENILRRAYVYLWESFNGYNFDVLTESIDLSIKSRGTTVKDRWISRSRLFESPKARKNRVKQLLETAKTEKDRRQAYSQLAEDYALIQEKTPLQW